MESYLPRVRPDCKVRPARAPSYTVASIKSTSLHDRLETATNGTGPRSRISFLLPASKLPLALAGARIVDAHPCVGAHHWSQPSPRFSCSARSRAVKTVAKSYGGSLNSKNPLPRCAVITRAHLPKFQRSSSLTRSRAPVLPQSGLRVAVRAQPPRRAREAGDAEVS